MKKPVLRDRLGSQRSHGFVFVIWVLVLTGTLAGHQSRTHGVVSPAPQSNGTAGEVDWTVFLPEGSGRTEVLLSCSDCHDLRLLITQRKSKSAWRTSVQKMISLYQAPVDREDLGSIVDYLSHVFDEKNPITHLPLDINTSDEEALARLPGITKEMARAIVEDRESNGRFVSVGELSRVRCIDEGILKRIEAYVTTDS